MRGIVNSRKILPGGSFQLVAPEAPVNRAAGREYVRAVRPRYTLAPAEAKCAILDEFLCHDWLSSQVRYHAAESSDAGPGPTAPAAPAAVPGAGDPHVDRDLEGRRVSLAGSPQGAPAAMAPVGPASLLDPAAGGAGPPHDAPQHHGSPPAAQETPGPSPPVRAHQTPARCSSITSPFARTTGTSPPPASPRSTWSPVPAIGPTARVSNR